MSTVRIDGAVAEIIDEHQLAINRGSEHGVLVGARVSLYRSVVVTDPDTKEDLGTVRLRKLRLIVNHVQDRLCVARVADRRPSEQETSSALRVITGTQQPLIRIERTTSSADSNWRPGVVGVQIGEQARIEVEVGDPGKEDDPPF